MAIMTGCALAVYVYLVVSGLCSGAHINSSVNRGLAVAGKLLWKQVPLYISDRLIVAVMGATLV